MKITVLRPITVPEGIFCWWWGRNLAEGEICDHFDNPGGHGICTLHMGELKDGGGGVLKPDACLNLERK
jgi:hypothetical protein